MPTKTEAIKIFLQSKAQPELAKLYTSNMECQVNVAQDNGNRIGGEYHGKMWHGWTDGIQIWKPFRIPRNANTSPEYIDTKMTFSLESHAEAIGMTGWDWVNRLSQWVAFDFDEITGHSDKHKKSISEEDLDTVKNLASKIDWVTLRKSSGGRGLHLYVFLEPFINTQNHNEHAALARAILGKLSSLTGFDFNAKVDICGGNMWIWHRKSHDSGGLELIKQGEPLRECPPQWRDHINVITGHRKKNLPRFISETGNDTTSDAERFFLELTGQITKIPLDSEHKKLIQWLEDHKCGGWWDQDHWMLVAHTYNLKRAHEELHFKGIFETLAKGSEAPSDLNCFLHPLRLGAWTVRRYSLGVQESSSWTQDGRGWTKCYYNRDPDLDSAARACGGRETPSGGFVFEEAEQAAEAAQKIGGVHLDLPLALRNQRATLKPHKDGRLIMEIEGDINRVTKSEMPDWLHDKGKWKRIFNIQTSSSSEPDIGNYDDLVRHIITDSGDDYGWVIKGEGDQWRSEPLVHVKASLEAMNLSPKEIKTIIGSSVMRCWKIVNEPFKDEYPGDRKWNRHAAQFRFIPSSNRDNLSYPHWLKILNHCGSSLDDTIRQNEWAKVHGIQSGADYLKTWIASMFRFPMEPLPYLFFYGPQDSGKSIFHESLAILLTKGYVRADIALINPQGFNHELEGSIFCVIEEINLRKDKNAYSRTKDWVTAKELSIHPKGRTPYHVPNSCHWCQMANDVNFCPIFPGDTRVTMCYVPEIPPEEKIPKRKMFEFLEKEAPDFLAEILSLEVPESNDRLNVPVLLTAYKIDSEMANQTPLQMFITERCHRIPGAMIKFSDFYAHFLEFIDVAETTNWSKVKVAREIPPDIPKGRSTKDGQMYIGNLSLDSDTRASSKMIMTPPDQYRNVFLIPEDQNGKYRHL